jgi:hypothetical protein
MHRIKRLTLCFALAASLAIPQTGWGCSCSGNKTDYYKAIRDPNVHIVFEGRVTKKKTIMIDGQEKIDDGTVYIVPETIYKGKIKAGWYNVSGIWFCNGFTTKLGQKHFFYMYTIEREGKVHTTFIKCLISKHSQEERHILEQYVNEKKHGTK